MNMYINNNFNLNNLVTEDAVGYFDNDDVAPVFDPTVEIGSFVTAGIGGKPAWPAVNCGG